jgi:hypothetical protein
MLALFAVAALTFTILAGVIEALTTRRPRRRVQAKPLPVLHPLTHHAPRGVRHPRPWRAHHYVGLFFAFLLVTYLGLVLLRAMHSIVADFF